MTDQTTATSSDPIHTFIAGTVAEHDVVLFMKGTPDAPRCGFSSLAVQILDHLGAPFVGVDVLQDAGMAHWNARFSAGDRKRWSWIALRHEIDYLRGLLPGATATARTWVGDPQGPRFNRYVRIEDGEGRLCAQGVSEWCLVDAATLRPTRIPADMLPAFERR